MSDQQVQAIKSLEIDNVKVYEARGDKLSVLAKGNLEILYLSEFNRFVLRVNTFKYILSAHLSVMATLSNEDLSRSYVFPNIGGHYVMKLKSTPTAIVIRNMETIFSNYSQFSYQQNHEHDLENQAHRRGDYTLTFGDTLMLNHSKNSNQSEAINKANRYIRIGGNILKHNIIKAANYVGKNVSQLKKPLIAAQGSCQLLIRTIEQLKSLDNNQTIDLPRYEVIALITIVKEVEKVALSHAEQDIGVKLNPASDRWPSLKKNAIESAHSLWKGMDDALGTLSKTMKAKRLNAKLPDDRMDITFKKINQNIKNGAPLPMHQVSPNQQQPEVIQQHKEDLHLKTQRESSTTHSSGISGSGSILRNLGVIKQKIVGIKGEGRSRAKENYAA